MFKASIFASLVIAVSASGASAATTFPAGQGQPFNNYQSSLAVNMTVTTSGAYPVRQLVDVTHPNAIGGDDTLAAIHLFAGSFVPQGTLAAKGATLTIAQNTALFSLLGTNYGGNGTTNFQLPDLQGRALVGSGAAAGLGGVYVGDQIGRPQVTLTTANLPVHDHDLPGGGTTLSAGGSQSYDSSKPGLGITYLIQTRGVFPGRSGTTDDGFLGQVEAFAGNFTPEGFAAADGRLMSIAENSALFSLLGTTYGGNGTTNFALPDLRGRSAVGVGSPTDGGASIRLGEVFGRADTTLTEAQMPAHSHGLPGGEGTSVEGASAAIANYGPSLGLNYIISTSGIYPSRNLTGQDALTDPDIDFTFTAFSSSSTLGQISLFAGDYAPGGWALANGQLLSIAQNQALFSLIGTFYGGDGRTTFALPDFRGRTAIGTGTSSFGESFGSGQTKGANSINLLTANLPPHAHMFLEAVPEPATWGMMIAGFGLVGAAMRRRKAAFA